MSQCEHYMHLCVRLGPVIHKPQLSKWQVPVMQLINDRTSLNILQGPLYPFTCTSGTSKRINQFDSCYEITVLFVLRKLILKNTHACSHPVGLDVSFLVGPFVYFYTSYARTVKALVRLRGCAGSPEPSLVAYVISTIITWAGSFGASMDHFLR